ncbi:ZNF335 [Branchiostoma lanceolatum]|uniref:ZNF335 protein n=1 Tax=Branchiostoma lanceolatum TaxID=7740 RepID=A0A8K0EQW4_BRALA|nr:ZNF335 [Branchiostoma lanceolatum]
MRVALTDVELGSTEDNTLFKAGVERKKDPPSSPGYTVVNAPKNRNTNVKGTFPYTGIGRPSKHNIPTVSITPGLNSSVSPKIAKDKDSNKANGMEVQTCKIAKLRGNGSAIEWIQVDLTEASINDYIKSKKAKLAEDEKAAYGGQKVMHKKEQGQTSVREAHIKEPHPEVRGQQQGIDEMEGKPEINQQRDNEKEKHSERVVQALEQDEVNSKVEQVPLQNSGKENHSETVLQAIEQDQVKDEVKIMSVIHEQETGGKKPNSETTVEKQHQLKVQKESVVSQKEIPTIETDSETVQQVEQQQTALEDDDNVVNNQKETAGTEIDSEKVAQDKHQQQIMLEEDSTIVKKQQESIRKEHHSENVVQDRQQQQVALEEDDIDVVNQQGSTAKETHSETVEQVMQQQQTTLKDDYSAVINQQETAGNKTDSETVVQDKQQQQQMMLEEDITAVKKQQDTAGNQTDSETVVQDRQQQYATLEEDGTAAVVNQQETARNKTESEIVVQDRQQQQQVALEEVGTAVKEQQETIRKETDSEKGVHVRQQQQAALRDDGIDVVNQQETTGKETDSEAVEQDKQQQQQMMLEEDITAVKKQQDTAGNETDSETVVQDRQQQQIMLEEDDIAAEVNQQETAGNETDSETVVQDRQQQQIMLEENDIAAVVNQQETAGNETYSETVVQDRQQQQIMLEEDDTAAVVNQQGTAGNENGSEKVVQDRQQQQVALEEDDTAVKKQQETIRKEIDSEDVHVRQQQQIAIEEDAIDVVNQQETTGKETYSEAVEQVKQQQQTTLEEDGTAVINQQETNGRETDSEKVVQNKQQQIMLEEDDTAVINRQETNREETDPKTSAEDTEPIKVVSEDKDIPVIHQLETITEEDNSEMTVGDHQEVEEDKDVPVVSQQETDIADPSLEVPLECDGQTDSADRVGCVTDDDSEATDVYSFTEDNSTHGMDVDLGTMKTFPDPVQQHSVTVGQVQSTDVGQFVQTSTDANITVPDDQSDEECQDVETASVEASSTATDISQGETVMTKVPQSSKEKDIQSSKGMKKSSQSHYDPLSKIYLSCNQCPFKTFRKNNLRIHKEHHDPRCKHRKHTCQLCSYGCNGKDDFQKHLQLHKQDRAITVQPAVSGTAEQTNVIENETTVSTGDGDALVGNSDVSDDEEDDVKMKCPHCPFETHVPLSLELHVKHHKDICPHNQLQCKFCTFFCKTQTHMTRHVKLHKVAAEPLGEENHLNNICDVEKQAFYAYDFDLNQENCPEKIDVHSTVTKQTEVKEQHVCVKCTVVFRSRYRLLIHKIQHETGTYLRCEECKFRTKKQKKYQFLAHLNAHFNMKPYKCKFCPYRAGCYSTVFKHILKSHNTKHSRYRCNKCSFSCKGLGWLKRHQKLHLQGQVVPTEGNKYGKYDIEVENIIVCGKYKQKKMDVQDEAMRTTDGVSSTTMVSPQKHAGISCVREVQNTTDGSVEFWFLCRFCGKMHVDQESWFAHVQRHIISSAWHPKNALSSQPAQREETYPTIGSPRGMLCPGEESESRQQHVVMEKHSVTDGQSENALDTEEEYNYAGIQGNVDATASQKCDEKEWSRENSLKEELEETADCSASLEGSREEDADVTGDQLLRNRLNSTDSTVACLQDSNPCGSGSTLDTDDDSDLPPLLKTTNELELAFVFPPDKQAELIREQLAQHETASIGSEDNPVPSLQEIEPEGHEEPTYLPHCDNGSSASCSGSMLGSSDDRLSSVGSLMSEQREEETGTDLSAWISALQYDQTSEVEGAICATVPGLPPGKTIRCQFCGLQFDSQLTFLQHKMRHLQ